jgi:hypothetical protein
MGIQQIAFLKKPRSLRVASGAESNNTGLKEHDLYLGYEGAGWYVCRGKRKITKISSESFSEAMETVSGYKYF